MDINSAAKEYGNGVITSLKKNRRILIMMLLFAAGMIIGAVSLKRADSYLSGAFSDMFSVYIRSKGSQSLGMNFINSLAVNAAFMLAVFVFGLCAVGLPLICILPIIRGVGIGMLSGYLYSNFALRGLGYCVLVIYPGLIPAIFALLLACSAGINSSYEMLLSLSSVKAQRGEGSIKIYCMRFLIICILYSSCRCNRRRRKQTFLQAVQLLIFIRIRFKLFAVDFDFIKRVGVNGTAQLFVDNMSINFSRCQILMAENLF